VLSVATRNCRRRSGQCSDRPAKKCSGARSQRVRPHLDDKVLASWNGMMLGALARAYAVLGDETYRAAAEKNLAAFLQDKLWDAPPKRFITAGETAGAIPSNC
jgi:uncharacterized protein